jgi:hypothetical protein
MQLDSMISASTVIADKCTVTGPVEMNAVVAGVIVAMEIAAKRILPRT